jgi:hypothetical protein
MRMWGVDPSVMCRRHLLGEHVEMHMLAGCVARGKSIRGYIDGGLVEVGRIRVRHDELSEEIRRRGYRHESPLPQVSLYSAGRINREENLLELGSRCPDCRERIESEER